MATGHRYIPAGMGEIRCAACMGPADARVHLEGLRDQVGADLVECPGCNERFWVEDTIRMLRFKEQDGKFRVCKACAGIEPFNPYARLARKLAEGWLTEEQYLDALEKLDA